MLPIIVVGETMNQYESSQFSTPDLSLATALVSCGFSICDIEKTPYNGRSIFIFGRVNGLDKTIQAFWSDELLVNPKQYFDVLKHIKTRLYSGE